MRKALWGDPWGFLYEKIKKGNKFLIFPSDKKDKPCKGVGIVDLQPFLW